jgi:hypothetical protein
MTPRTPERDVSVITTVTVDPSRLVFVTDDTSVMSSSHSQRNTSMSCEAELAMSSRSSKFMTLNGFRCRWLISTGSPAPPDRTVRCRF